MMKDRYKANVYMLPFLTPDEIPDSATPCVYFMFSGTDDTLLYVGQTKNLKNKVSQHSISLDNMAGMLDDKSLRVSDTRQFRSMLAI